MEGTWDMKNRCFTIYAPPGIAEAYTQFQGVDVTIGNITLSQ